MDNYHKTVSANGLGLMHAEGGNGFKSNIIDGISSSKTDRNAGKGIHCTVKPLELMKHLIELVVPEDSSHIVLDPFAGSGTTALAAKESGRSYFCVEIVEEYCKLAKQRLHGDEKSPKNSKPKNLTPVLFD